MSDWVAEAMRNVFDTVIVVGREAPISGLEAIPDSFGSHLGPLSGVATALEAYQRPIVAIAVDQPLIRVDTLERLAEFAAADETAVFIDGVEQVTCAAYSSSLSGSAREVLNTNGSIRALIRQAGHIRIEESTWRGWGEDGRSWCSLDSMADIVEAEQRYRIDLLGN